MRLLDSLAIELAQSEGLSCVEIILVADRIIMQYLLARFISSMGVYVLPVDGIRSPSIARNIGARASQGEWLCFVDSDVVLAPGYFDALQQNLCNGDEIVVPRVEAANSVSVWGRLEHHHDAYALKKYINGSETDVLVGHNFVIHRHLFEAVGGFRAEFCAAEDRDMGFRLRQAGYTIRYNPSLVCYHRYPDRLVDIIRRKWWHGKGCARLYRDYEHTRKGFREWLDYFMLPSFNAFGYDVRHELIYRGTAKVAFFLSVLKEGRTL